MAQAIRKIHVEVRDPSGQKICDLYDSSLQFAGQIADISLTRSTSELDALDFSLPLEINEAGAGRTENPLWQYLKNENLIWYTDERGTDVFRIKQPEQTVKGSQRNGQVNRLQRKRR